MVAHRSQRSIWPISIGAGLFFCLFVVFAWLVVRHTTDTRGAALYEQDRAKARNERLEKQRAAEAAELSKLGWVDKKTGIARIPVQDAMTLAVQTLENKKPHASAVPVATPAPLPAPAAAASPAATPAAAPAASPPAPTESLEVPAKAAPEAPPAATPATTPTAIPSPAP